MNIVNFIKNRYKENKINASILTLFFLFVLTSLIYFLIDNNFRNVFLCCIFSIIPLFCYFVEYKFKMKFPPLFLGGMIFVGIGALLGSCYNVYQYIPIWDTILHGTTGFMIPCLGFALMNLLVKDMSGAKRFYACLIFAIGFSLSITVIWEVFEYTINTFFGFDMLTDTMVYNIKSYYISGDQNILYTINDIQKTIIYYGENQILTINGYLDIGVIDTFHDILIHLACTILFSLTSIMSYKHKNKINKLLIPEI